MNSPEIKKLIDECSYLFWWVPKEKKSMLPLESLVEAILNYGDIYSVRKLFSAVGIKKVAEIFYKQTNQARTNYQPQTKHYFLLYFKKHA